MRGYFVFILALLLIPDWSYGQMVFLKNSGNKRLGFELFIPLERNEPIDIKPKQEVVFNLERYSSFLYSTANIENRVHLIVFPNDSIDLSFNSGTVSVTSLNKDKKRNEDFIFLSKFTEKFGPINQVNKKEELGYPLPQDYDKWKKLDDEYFKHFKKRGTPPPKDIRERDSILYSIFIDKSLFFEHYIQQNKLTDRFVTYFRNYLRFQYFCQTLEGINATQDFANPAVFFQKILNDGNVNFSDSFLEIEPYRRFVFIYVEYINALNNNKDVSLQQHFFVTDSLYTQDETKNFVLFRFLESSLKKREDVDSVLLAEFDTKCTDIQLQSIIRSRINLSILQKKGNKNADLIMAHNKTTLTLSELLQRQDKQKKIFYIDFWASWCMPCIQEIKDFTKNPIVDDEVGYMYISTDKDVVDWERARKKFNILNENNSFLLVNSLESPITKTLKINTIPRYIVVDRNGKVIDSDAPRPSSPNFKDYLQKIKSKNFQIK